MNEIEQQRQKIAELEHSVKQLRDTLNGIEFSVVEVGKQGNPSYTRRQKLSVGMGVHQGEIERINNVIVDGDSINKHLIWDGSSWSVGSIVPDGDATNKHLVWSGSAWIKGVIVPDGDATNKHLVWSGSAWVKGVVVPNGSSSGDMLRWDGSAWESFVPDSVTAITGIQYDSTSKQFQIKTTALKVADAGTESAWGLMAGGQAVGCS